MTILKTIPTDIWQMAQKKPDFTQGFERVAYEYKTHDNELLGVVLRYHIKADNDKGYKKNFAQYQFDLKRKKYLPKGIDGAIYLLPEALATNNKIIAVEGEKTALALQELVGAWFSVITIAGGSNKFSKANLTCFQGREVIFWPDNDKAGEAAMSFLERQAKDANMVLLGRVKVAPEWQPKWDADDVIKAYGKDYVLKALNTLEQCNPIGRQEDVDVDKKRYEFLGRDSQNNFWFYSFDSESVVHVSHKLDQRDLLSVVADSEYWCNAHGRTKFDGVDCNKVVEYFFTEAAKRPVYEPDTAKNIGVYETDKGYIANLGSYLYRDKEVLSHRDLFEEDVYLSDRDTGIDVTHPAMTDQESRQLASLFESTQFRREHRQILLGWVYSTFLTGILPVRPHLWIYGIGGTGKTFVRDTIRNCVGDYCVSTGTNNTTEAGLRQAVGSRRIPVIWNEAEPDKHEAHKMWANIENVIKASFDEEETATIKGSRGGIAVKTSARMMFAFFGTVPLPDDETLLRRMVIFKNPINPQSREFAIVKQRCSAISNAIEWKDLPSRLFRRVFENIDVFMHNYNWAYAQLSTCVKDKDGHVIDVGSRAKALAVCYAGYLLSKHTKKMDFDDQIGMGDLSEANWLPVLFDLMPKSLPETEGIIEQLFMYKVRCSIASSGRQVNISLSEFIKAKTEKEEYIRGCYIDDVETILRQEGFIYTPTRCELFIWGRAPNLERYFGKSWRRKLEGCDNYKDGAIKTVYGRRLSGFSFSIDKF
jgi:5S rRNA maturation endonuclease (ribonuclease M5)